MILAQESQKRTKSSLLQDIIAALWAITRNVSKSPDGLFANIIDSGRKQLDEFWNSSCANDSLSVIGCTRCDICERPRSFELQMRGLGRM